MPLDSLLSITGAAKAIVTDLLQQEDHQRALMDSLRRNNRLDSLTIARLILRQNEQKALLLNLEKETILANKSHQRLIAEINKLKPRFSDLIIPSGGAVLGFALTNGSSSEKAAMGLLIFAATMTLKHFGVY